MINKNYWNLAQCFIYSAFVHDHFREKNVILSTSQCNFMDQQTSLQSSNMSWNSQLLIKMASITLFYLFLLMASSQVNLCICDNRRKYFSQKLLLFSWRIIQYHRFLWFGSKWFTSSSLYFNISRTFEIQCESFCLSILHLDAKKSAIQDGWWFVLLFCKCPLFSFQKVYS